MNSANETIETTISKGRRAGFAAICGSLPSIQAAIDRLVADGHLPGRNCEVWKTKAGWQPVVYRGGKVRRIFQGECVGARVTRGLGPKTDRATVAIEA